VFVFAKSPFGLGKTPNIHLGTNLLDEWGDHGAVGHIEAPDDLRKKWCNFGFIKPEEFRNPRHQGWD
jgi:hypothetical protein